MPKKSEGKPASALHKLLLFRLRQAFAAKAKELKLERLSIKQGMEKAGSSEQLYNQIQNGQSPKLITVEAIAAALGFRALDLLQEPKVPLSPHVTPETAAFAIEIDEITFDLRSGVIDMLRKQLPSLIAIERSKQPSEKKAR